MEGIEEFRLRARNWLAEADLPIGLDDYDETFRLLRDWHRTLYRAGWVGIQWPTQYGGRGLTIGHHLAFNSELARVQAPQPVGAIGLDVVGPTILQYGTDKQRDRFIGPLLSGEEIWCQGFSEPEAGSDLAALRTSAKLDGDELVISGQKVWTSWATDADWCAVLVRTDPEAVRHKGISYVLVNMRTPGITVRPIVQITGDAEFCELFFDEVRVPVENILGEMHGGWVLAMNTLGHERAGYAIRRRIENEVSFNRMVDRLARNPDTCSDPDVATDIGHIHIQMRALEAISERTASRLLAGEVPSAHDSIDKLMLSQVEQELFGKALDLLGGARMAPESSASGLGADEVIKGYLYGRAASIYGGSAQIQRTLVAERLLGLPRVR